MEHNIVRPCGDECALTLCEALAINPNWMARMMQKQGGQPDVFRAWAKVGDDTPPFWEGCCAVKEAYPDGVYPSGVLLQTKLGKALLSKKNSKKGPATVHPDDPMQLAFPPPGVSTANVCKVRGSWAIAAPRKPVYEELNTCLDTGDLVMPAK